MKAKLLPLYFKERNPRETREFEEQLKKLQILYGAEADFLPPQPLGEPVPPDADAIVFPQLLGAVFQYREFIESVSLPIIILTSEFGTVEMWDWEIVAYLRGELGRNVFSPYQCELAKVVLRALSAKRKLRSGMKFLMLQDNPGEGMQAYLFKRFYWWDKSCTRQIEDTFGVQIVYRSWKEVNFRAAQFSDAQAQELWNQRPVSIQEVPQESILKAVKLYLAIRELILEIGGVCGAGANCLNESFHSATTPCLAWNWLFEYDHIIWACEGDTVTLISKFILYSALKTPMMMTNIYPFLVGMAALKHEKIQRFPSIDDPDSHALGVHCGYFGFAPQSFCTQWVMRPKVLDIVSDDAVVIDCRMAAGPITMAKLRSDMKKLTIIEAEIEDYVQYPGSDCRNGALLRYRNGSGHKVMESLSSHHAILIQGDVTYKLLQMAKVYGFDTEVI